MGTGLGTGALGDWGCQGCGSSPHTSVPWPSAQPALCSVKPCVPVVSTGERALTTRAGQVSRPAAGVVLRRPVPRSRAGRGPWSPEGSLSQADARPLPSSWLVPPTLVSVWLNGWSPSLEFRGSCRGRLGEELQLGEGGVETRASQSWDPSPTHLTAWIMVIPSLVGQRGRFPLQEEGP